MSFTNVVKKLISKSGYDAPKFSSSNFPNDYTKDEIEIIKKVKLSH